MCAGGIRPFVTVVAMASGMQTFQGQSHSNQGFSECKSELQLVFMSFKKNIDELLNKFNELTPKNKSLQYSDYVNQMSKLKDESLNNGEKILNDYLSKLSKEKDSSLFKEEYGYFEDAITMYGSNYGVNILKDSLEGGSHVKYLCF